MAVKAIFLHGTVLIDGWLVSSLGEAALASMGLAAAIGGIILGIIFAFSHAMQIRAAQAFGTADPVYLKSTLLCGLTISMAIGGAGLAFIFLFGPSLIDHMAPNRDVALNAWLYLRVFSLVVLLESVGQCLSSFFNGCGRTRLPLYGYALSVPINILCSVALIHGLWGLPSFGVTGAAMGSAIGVAVQVVFFAIRFLQIEGHLVRTVGWRHVSFARTLKRYFLFTLPIAATFSSATLATHLCMLIYARMALNDFAAMTLIAPWNMVAGQIAMQWTQATGIIVAQLLGRRANEATLDAFLSKAWRGAFVAAGMMGLVFLGLSMSIEILYADLSPETRATLLGFMPILLITSFPRATNAICGNTLRASGDTIYVMQIFLWSQWVFRVPATALAVLVFEVPAFWVLSLILAEELVKFWPFHSRLWRGDWKRAVVTE